MHAEPSGQDNNNWHGSQGSSGLGFRVYGFSAKGYRAFCLFVCTFGVLGPFVLEVPSNGPKKGRNCYTCLKSNRTVSTSSSDKNRNGYKNCHGDHIWHISMSLAILQALKIADKMKTPEELEQHLLREL